MRLAKWSFFVFFGVLALAAGGVRHPFPPTEIAHEKPYADFVGREYRVKSDVSAYAWNDFPNKTKIVTTALLPPPGVRNRFVSYVTPLKIGQRIRIMSAWWSLVLFGFHKYYVVSIPGAGLPEGVDVKIDMNSDGIPDPNVYEPTGR